jgi:hypothetical protein
MCAANEIESGHVSTNGHTCTKSVVALFKGTQLDHWLLIDRHATYALKKCICAERMLMQPFRCSNHNI